MELKCRFRVHKYKRGINWRGGLERITNGCTGFDRNLSISDLDPSYVHPWMGCRLRGIQYSVVRVEDIIGRVERIWDGEERGRQ